MARYLLVLGAICAVVGIGLWWASQPTYFERQLVGYWRLFDDDGEATCDIHFQSDGRMTYRFPDSSFDSFPAVSWWCRGDMLFSYPKRLTLKAWIHEQYAIYWQKLGPATTGQQIVEVDDNTLHLLHLQSDTAVRLERIDESTPPLSDGPKSLETPPSVD